MSDNQIARLDEDNLKIEPAVEETISQSEQQLRNTDVRPSLQDKASAATSSRASAANNPKPQSLHEHQQETEINPTDLENLYPQTCFKKEGRCDVSKKHQET